MSLIRLLKQAAIVVGSAIVLVISGAAVPANAEALGGPACLGRIADLVLPTEKVHSGGEASGTVRLECPSRRGVTVTLASADSSWVTVPQKVTVPAGGTEASFPIQTHQPDNIFGTYSVSITAKVRHREVTRALELQPGLKFFQVDSPVISGDSVSVNVGLNGTAPEGGMAIAVHSDNEALRLPPTIKIPQGALGVIGSYGKTVRVPQDANVTVTATLPGQSKTAVVALRAWTYDPGDWSLTGAGSAHGGRVYDMTLDLPNPVPHGGVEVTFTSDNPKVDPPSPLTLTEGTSGSRTVGLSTRTDIDATVTITATIEGVGSRSHTVRVRPGLQAIEVPWLIYGGQSFEATVRLGTVTSEPLTITLASDNPTLQVPAEVHIPAGASSVSFTATTAPVEDLSYATLTARLGTMILTEEVLIDPAPE